MRSNDETKKMRQLRVLCLSLSLSLSWLQAEIYDSRSRGIDARRSQDRIASNRGEGDNGKEEANREQGIRFASRSIKTKTIDAPFFASTLSRTQSNHLEPRRRLGVVLGHERLADEPDGVERVRGHGGRNREKKTRESNNAWTSRTKKMN